MLILLALSWFLFEPARYAHNYAAGQPGATVHAKLALGSIVTIVESTVVLSGPIV